MPNPVCEVLLSDAPLAVPHDPAIAETGAIADFWGVVRLTEEGAVLSGIEYEAHREMAEYQLRKIGEEGAARFGVEQVHICHRVGFVAVGEPSLLVRVLSRHRSEAFRAIVWTVDELKKRAPIWKHPRFE